jgi:alanyl-tRNA synthetase
VIRRILRRAIRYGYQTLGLKEPFMGELSVVLGQTMGEYFTELITQKDIIQKVIHEEEVSFFRTLELGIRRIELLISQKKSENSTVKNSSDEHKYDGVISGYEAFELYDTFGFPLDLISLIARENNILVKEEDFEAELQKQKDRSRAATAIETDDWVQLQADQDEKFVGYDQLTAELEIIKYRKVSQKQKTFYQLVFNQTPFYPEGGGQVGDTGFIEAKGEKTSIFDTKKENNLIVHLTEKLPTDPKASFIGNVDKTKRTLSACNHSATHLLHHALRKVLGTHVEQKGSLVNAKNLRFDFSHFSKVTNEELKQIEELVNANIRESILLNEHRNIPIEEAKAMGAMALFGEKYGDSVRAIQFGESIELCGGTHVASTSAIGLFKITSEAAVAAGIRRIEAITNTTAEEFYRSQVETLNEIKEVLKNPKNIVEAVEELNKKNAALQKQIEVFQREKAQAVKHELKTKIEGINGINFLGTKVNLDAGSIKDIAYQLKGETSNFVGIFGGVEEDKCSLTIIIDEALAKEKGLDAGKIIREISKHIQGGGGGQAFFATAGGKNKQGVDKAIEEFRTLVN